MTHPALIERITRSLAYMLRHQPEEFDLEVDEHGFAELDDVVRALNERLGEAVDEDDVRDAVGGGDRQRYEVVGSKIRALYGHSIDVLPGEPSAPPAELFVGVSSADADRARRHGLRAGRRRFLHLALTPEDAIESGRRVAHDYVVITVHAADAWEEGINFYDRRSLFLSDPIPTAFLEVGDVRTDGFGEDVRDRGGRREDRGGGRRHGGGGRHRGGRGEERHTEHHRAAESHEPQQHETFPSQYEPEGEVEHEDLREEGAPEVGASEADRGEGGGRRGSRRRGRRRGRGGDAPGVEHETRAAGPREERGWTSEPPQRRVVADRPTERAPRERDEGYREARPHDAGRDRGDERPRHEEHPRREAPRHEGARSEAPRHADSRRGGPRHGEPRHGEPRREDRPRREERPRHEEFERARQDDRPRHGGGGHDRPARAHEGRGTPGRTPETRREDSSAFGLGLGEAAESQRRSEPARRANEPRQVAPEPKRERRAEADDSGFGAGI